jgi:pSer/pThr/pTyr-binding forkhead associated (FHA) protein
MAKVLLKFNEAVLKEIPLEGDQFTIGRKPDNSIVIDNPAVSGHHARLVRTQDAFVVEDLGSTNGTFVNDVKVEKRPLRNGDRVLIGKHLLLFQDEAKAGAPPPLPPAADADKTMILDTQKQREMLKAAQTQTAISKPPEKLGVLQVVSGQTDRKEYQLTGRLAIIGSQEGATVKLTGWFAPKVAALIGRRNEGYNISLSEEGKKILVNGAPIQGRYDLNDGDLLEVAGVKMYFYLKSK